VKPRLVLTREDNGQWAMPLAAHFEVLVLPVTMTRWIPEADVRHALTLRHPRTIGVTSARGAQAAFWAHELFPDAPVLAIGPTTAAALTALSVPVAGVADPSTARDLAMLVDEGPVLVPGAADPLRDLDEALAARGVTIERVTAYETVPVPLDDEARHALGGADIAVVAAPSAWMCIEPFVPASTLVVAIGPTTAAAVRQRHARTRVGATPQDLLEAWRAESTAESDN
jgi:uroporphyrinogen-III synthase